MKGMRKCKLACNMQSELNIRSRKTMNIFFYLWYNDIIYDKKSEEIKCLKIFYQNL
jgi:hypothetical protein